MFKLLRPWVGLALLALALAGLVGGGPVRAQTSSPLTFAVIGDYGQAGPNEAAVAALVKSWDPAFVVTVGDDNYPSGSAATIDANIGQYYHEFIAPYKGSYGPGASENRFWPTLGNHDWIASGAAPYLAYFTLPGVERYYTIARGPVQIFAVDSDPNEPHGVTATSVQGQWLQGQLAASTACWKLVFFHHPPYSSGLHGSNLWMQWPFAAWGASAVLAGHDHTYERIVRDGFPYFVNGLGGASIYGFGLPVTGSAARYNASYGAMRVTATETSLTYQFITTAGTVVDTYTQTGGCALAATPTVTETAIPTATSTEAPAPTTMPTATATETPAPTASATPVPTLTPTPTPTVAPTPTPVPCCDLNTDGVVDIRDIQLLAAAWGTANPAYDFDGSGVVDLPDLLRVVGRWRQMN